MCAKIEHNLKTIGQGNTDYEDTTWLGKRAGWRKISW